MTEQLYKVSINRYPLDHKIPQGDPIWARFNAGFDNSEITPLRLANALFEGRSITTWHKDNRRITANYLLGQHIGLDFDSGPNADMYQLLTDRFVNKYGSLVYTTMSHTEEEPRCRAIFLLDTPIMQAKNYTMAVSALLWIFGTADRQCKDAVRFFYGSPNCQFQLLGNVLPLEVVKKTITSYLESGAREKKKTTNREYSAPASQQEVADALTFIPPWGIDYDEWLQVLMGIHSQFGDAGFSLADSWGQGKDDEVARKWKSFDKSGNGEGAITIATVFGIAKRFGWRKNG